MRRYPPLPRHAVSLWIAWLCLLSGCAGPELRARREAARMLDPRRSVRQQLTSQQRLIELGQHSEPYLDRAFFPIGLYDVPAHALDEMAAAGFNLVVNAQKDEAYLTRCDALGLRAIPYIDVGNMDADVVKASQTGAIHSWYICDEPDLNKMPVETVREHFHALRQADPQRPVYLTVWSLKRYAEFVPYCDVFAPNPYPIVKKDAAQNNLRWVSIAVRTARRLAGDRPVWAIIQAFWAEPWWPRSPTAEELRAMVYLALNQGAKGIIYFSYRSGDRPITGHEGLFAMIRKVNGELSALKPLLLKDPLPASALSVSSDDATTDEPDRKAPPVDCSLRRFGERQLLIAVNPDPVAKTATVRIAEAGRAHATAVELFTGVDQPPLEIEGDACLKLRLDPFQVRVLLLR